MPASGSTRGGRGRGGGQRAKECSIAWRSSRCSSPAKVDVNTTTEWWRGVVVDNGDTVCRNKGVPLPPQGAWRRPETSI